MDRYADIAIVGAGIVGLAHAYMALKKGNRVVLFERDQFAVGASVRNFGLLWPIGQEPGINYDRAIRSKNHWIEIAREAGIWLNNSGSLHLAYHDDEWNVLHEFISQHKNVYDCTMVTPSEIGLMSPSVVQKNLKGGLLSSTEATVYAREAIRMIPQWLAEKFGLILKFGHVVTEVSLPLVKTARETWNVNQVIICSGADFETLYPAQFDQQPVTKCKLQMMKATTSSPVHLGPALCAGLTLRHYSAFKKCESLKAVDTRYDQESSYFKKYGIHVLVSQNAYGELIIGDSHEYNTTIEPFDNEDINTYILEYLKTFLNTGDLSINQRWHGVYPKVQNNNNLIIDVERGVKIVTGLGGAGMTLSFGLAEEIIDTL